VVGENSRKKLERGKSLYDQSETIFLGKELPDKLLDNGYMLTHASPTGDIETLITKEACDEHFFHYVVAITQKRFIVGHMQTPGTLVFVFNSWQDLSRAVPLAVDKFRKLELQLVLDAAAKVEVKESTAIQKKSDIITPADFRAMRDRKRFR
jgi:hypothetical protein